MAREKNEDGKASANGKSSVHLKIPTKVHQEWKRLSKDLFTSASLDRADVKTLICTAVDEFKVNVSNYSPQNRTRLINFARACCGGRVNDAVEVLLNDHDGSYGRI